MRFNSYAFALFFAALLPSYWLLRKWRPAQNVLLLAAGYYFYACWNPKFLSLLILSTVVDYACGLWLGRVESPRGRRAHPRPEHGAQPGHARVFQVFQFLRREPARLAWRVRVCRIPLRHLEVVLPIGISFYTFQSMSYVIDVYRREIKPTRNLVQFATFVSFFPHLVAGPIMRPTSLLPQVASQRRFDLQQFYEGSYLIFWGLLKKVVVADNLAIIVNDLFGRWADARRRPGLAGGLRLCVPDLRRLLGLHRHRPRRRQVPGLRDSAELQSPVLRHQPAGLLEPLAHQPLDLAPRLPLHPAGRQPRRHAADLPQPDADDGPRRPLARRRLDVRGLGHLPGPLAGRPPARIALAAIESTRPTRSTAPAGKPCGSWSRSTWSASAG